MDCKTAQLLLDCARPHCNELDAEDANALEDHFAGCPDCAALARTERHLDEHLGKAMRNVEVPDTLRAHLLNRLDAERNDWYKRWAGHGLRTAVAVAACVLLVVGGVAGYLQYRYANRSAPNLDDLTWEYKQREQSPPERADVEAAFKKQGLVTVLPDFKYDNLRTYGIADFQGVQVPQLVFAVNGDGMNTPRENAIVYVLSSKQFQLKDLTTSTPSPSGYQYSVDVQHQPGGSFAYVVVHTGNNYDWLKK